MAQSTLNSAFRARLLTDFYYNLVQFDSFGDAISIGTGFERYRMRGSANFILQARGSGLNILGSTVVPSILGTFTNNLTPQWEIQGSKLVYIGGPIEIDIATASTVVDLNVLYSKVTQSPSVVSGGTEIPEQVTNTAFVLFPVNIVFTEANGKIVINNIEFELE